MGNESKANPVAQRKANEIAELAPRPAPEYPTGGIITKNPGMKLLEQIRAAKGRGRGRV